MTAHGEVDVDSGAALWLGNEAAACAGVGRSPVCEEEVSLIGD